MQVASSLYLQNRSAQTSCMKNYGWSALILAPIHERCVSSLGRVRDSRGIISHGHERSVGYRVVQWSQTDHSVDRLVARAFIGPSPSPHHVVNHKDGIRGNNRVDNLEYVTPGENNLHASVDRSKARQAGCSKPVIGRTLESDIWLACTSGRSAAQCLGVPHSCISRCCCCLQKQTRGYEFKWAPPSELPLLPGEQWREVVLGNRTAMLKQQHSMMDVHRSPLCPPVSKPLRSSPG